MLCTISRLIELQTPKRTEIDARLPHSQPWMRFIPAFRGAAAELFQVVLELFLGGEELAAAARAGNACTGDVEPGLHVSFG